MKTVKAKFWPCLKLFSGSTLQNTLSCPFSAGEDGDAEAAVRGPLSSEFGTIKTTKARFWPCLEPFLGESLANLFALEATQRQMNGSFSQFQYKFHLEEVASV